MIDTPLGRRLLIALAGLVFIAGFVAVGVRAGLGGFAKGYELSATFDRVLQGLDTSSNVKVRGVTVGSVKAIEVGPDGRVTITMRMKPDMKLADTSSASIESLSVFGPKFVNVVPGVHETSGPFLREGATLAKTTAPLDFLDVVSHGAQLLRAVDAKDLLAGVVALGEGLDGLGPELGRTVDAASVITTRTNRRVASLQSLLRDLADVSSTLSDRGDEVASTARDLHGLLPEVATRPDQMGELLDKTAAVTATLADILEAHPDAVSDAVVGVANLADAIHRELPGLPALIDGLNAFFAGLGGIIQVPGPDGTRFGAVHAFVPADICVIVVAVGCGGPSESRAVRTAAPASLPLVPAPGRGASTVAATIAPAVVDLLLPLPRKVMADLLALWEAGR